MKKLFVLLLAVAMVFTMLPTASRSFAWAEENDGVQEEVGSLGVDSEVTESYSEGEEGSTDVQNPENDKRNDGESMPSDDPDVQEERQDFDLSVTVELDESAEKGEAQEESEPVVDENKEEAPAAQQEEPKEEQKAEEPDKGEPSLKKNADSTRDVTYTINTSSIVSTCGFNEDLNLLNGVTVRPATYSDGETEEPVLIRVKSATPSTSSSEFDSSNDYDPETSTLNVKNEDGAGHTRGQVTYTVVYEAYVGEQVLAEKTITIDFFNDSVLGQTVSDDVAYIREAGVTGTYDGIAPFDPEEGPGYDTGDQNKIVRTFDTVTTTVKISNNVYRDSSAYTHYKSGWVGFEFVLEGDYQKVEFNLDPMQWLETKQAKYKIFEVEKNGKKYQVMRGKFLWKSEEEGQPAIGSANLELHVSYNVLGMKNGDKIEPDFTFWMIHNDVPQKEYEIQDRDNYDDFPTDNYKFVKDYADACGVHDRVEPVHFKGDKVQVSAAPWYNAVLTDWNSNQFVSGYYDLATGDYSSDTETDTSIEGRCFCFGVIIQIRRPGAKGSKPGIKGCELPDGEDIKVSLKLDNFRFCNEQNETVETGLFSLPILWSCESNDGNWNSPYLQSDGREIPARYKMAMYAPYNQPHEATQNKNDCFNGGTWTAEQNGTEINATVSDYELDLKLSSIPRRNAYSRDTTYTYYGQDAKSVKDVYELCFSAGEFWFVQPFHQYEITTDDEGNVTKTTKGISAEEHYGTTGFYRFSVADGNLQITSESVQSLPIVTDNSNQTCTEDDEKYINQLLTQKGNIDSGTGYVAPGNNTDHYYNANDPLTPNCGENGEDWITPGGKLKIVTCIFHSQGDSDYLGVAYDQLLKFDDRFFNLEKVRHKNVVASNRPYRTVNILYAANPDNPSGWDHRGLEPDEDGYDQDMKETEADDLIYFTSLENLESAGYTCVGVLEEIRGLYGDPQTETDAMYLILEGTAKDDLSNVGDVFMETIESHAWVKKNVTDKIRAYYERYDPSFTGELTDDRIAWYMDNRFPRKIVKTGENTYEEGTVVSYDRYSTAFFDKQYSSTSGLRNYEKVSYNPDGSITGSVGYNYGDSCLVVGYVTGIDIDCAQSKYNGDEKTAYDMDTGQRVVDYVVHPTISINQPSEGWEGMEHAEYTTQVTVDVTLPEKLTYIPESSYLGGTYEQTGEGRQGNVVGGTPLETIVINNDDGTTTLRYVYEVTVDWTDAVTEGGNLVAYLDPIYLSCDIGEVGSDNDVQNADQLTVYAQIESTEDNMRPKTSENGNLAEQTIVISKGAALSLADYAEQVAVDTGQNVSFISKAVNDSNNPRPNAAIVVHIPMDGYNGTHYHGDRTIEEFKVPASGYTVWYSTSTAEYDRDDHTASEVTSGWRELTVNADGTVDFTGVDTTAITAIAVVGDIPARGNVEIRTVLGVRADEAGDYFRHWVSTEGLASYARSFVVKRSIRGLAWVDDDLDGLQKSSELTDDTVAPITVTLMQLRNESLDASDIDNYDVYEYRGGEATIALGKSLDVLSGELTDMQGYKYDFTNMPQGVYAVKFNNSDSTIASRYRVTDKDVNGNANDNKDSDATYVNTRSARVWGVVDGSYITGIELPETNTITTSHYISNYHDLGIAVMTYDLEIGKEAETLARSTAQADPDKEFTFVVKIKEEADDALTPYAGKYTLIKADGTTENGTTANGQIKLRAGERALIEDIEINAQYSVSEAVPEEADGYIYDTTETTGVLTSDLTGDNAIIKNNQYKTREISVEKTWKNADGSTTVPEGAKVTFEVLAGGESTGKMVELDGTADENGEDTAWTATFKELPVYKMVNGEAVEIEYTVVETGTWPGYTVSYGENNETAAVNEGTITNEQETTEVSVTKAWKNADGTTAAPEGAKVTFTLQADGASTGKTIELDGTVDENGEDTAWKATFKDLPKYKIVDGEAVEIVYTVKETTEWPGYTASYGENNGTAASDNGTITNKQLVTRVKFTKYWRNADHTWNAPDGAKVTLTLLADGESTGKTIELDGTVDENGEDAAWTATFTNLPQVKVVNGEEVRIIYTAVETGTWPGYAADYGGNATSAHDGGRIINEQIKTEVSVEKAWKNADGSATVPEGAKVTLTLKADGADTGKTIELDGTVDENGEGEAWKATFKDLPKYKIVNNEAAEIEYTVVETGTWPGYSVSYGDNDETAAVNNGTITNEQETTGLKVKKAWKNADGTNEAPAGAEVTVTLLADGAETDVTVTLDGTEEEPAAGAVGFEGAPWGAYFMNLPKYKIVDGEAVEIEYTVKETTGWLGYTLSYEGESATSAANGEGIINTQETTAISVEKAWKNADGSTAAPEGGKVTLTLQADGAGTNYTVILDGEAEDTAPAVTGGYESEAWKASFVNLPKYKIVNGEAVEIEYTVKETTEWPGYEVAYEGENATAAAADGTITNNQKVTAISVEKAWKNADGTDTAPEGSKVTFTLQADGADTNYTITLDGEAEDTAPAVTGVYESEAWKASFVNLPKYKIVDGEAVEIEYTVKETTEWPGYSVSYPDADAECASDQETITNEQITTEVKGTKTWNDDEFFEDEDPVNGYERPESITINLLADGEKIKEKTVTEEDGWEYEFTSLPKYKIVDGEAVEIEYTIEESVIPGYAAVIDGTDVENTPVKDESVEPAELHILKADGLTFDKNSDEITGLEGAEFTVTDPDGIETVITTDENGEAAYTFEKEGTYTLVETGAPEGYENPEKEYTIEVEKYLANVALVDDQDVPGGKIWMKYYNLELVMNLDDEDFTRGDNSLIVQDPPEMTEVSGEKIWDDEDDKDGIRPKSITVELYADGEKIDETEVTAKDDWEFTFEDLPKMKDGEEIEYTIGEVEVEDYTTSIDGYTITNTHTPSDVPVPGPGPHTGDDTDMGLWFSIMAMAIAGLGIILMRRKTSTR